MVGLTFRTLGPSLRLKQGEFSAFIAQKILPGGLGHSGLSLHVEAARG